MELKVCLPSSSNLYSKDDDIDDNDNDYYYYGGYKNKTKK